MPSLDTDDDDEYDDDDAESMDDSGDDDPTVPCPSCGRPLYDDAPACPACGMFVTAEDFRHDRRPMWVVATALLCVAMAAWFALRPG